MTVSPELWQQVVDRDAEYVWSWSEDFIHHGVPFRQWRREHPVACIVQAIDPLNPVKCGGKQEVDHVKDQPMMGRRAPDDAHHLVAMCQEHNTWHPPRKELRQAEREYLKHVKETEAASA